MINEVISTDKCTGCSACENICPVACISMAADKEGFLQPSCDQSKCIHCDLCEKVCPVLNVPQLSQFTKCYGAYSLDDETRRQSSSGGIFSEIAKEVLNLGGRVYGSAYDSSWHVHHICIDNIEDLRQLRGAKYSQSDLGTCFFGVKTNLREGYKVLFSGTPCQVAGLKNFLQDSYENLVTVDFICHGVPSPAAWDAYVRYRARKDNEGKSAVDINLRSKRTGWSRYHYSNVYRYPSGKEYSALSGEDLYMQLFTGDYINRGSCAHCSFKGYDRASDITLGDFWGVWDEVPQMDDNKGTSVVLVHTNRGEQLFQKVSGRVKSCAVTPEQAAAQNPSLLVSAAANEKRGKMLAFAVEEDYRCIQTVMQKKSYGKQFLVKLKGKIRFCDHDR